MGTATLLATSYGSLYRCYHEHKDFEHGHESWLEVIEEEE